MRARVLYRCPKCGTEYIDPPVDEDEGVAICGTCWTRDHHVEDLVVSKRTLQTPATVEINGVRTHAGDLQLVSFGRQGR